MFPYADTSALRDAAPLSRPRYCASPLPIAVDHSGRVGRIGVEALTDHERRLTLIGGTATAGKPGIRIYRYVAGYALPKVLEATSALPLISPPAPVNE